MWNENKLLEYLGQLVDYAVVNKVLLPSQIREKSLKLKHFMKVSKDIMRQKNNFSSLSSLMDIILDQAYEIGLLKGNRIDERDAFESALFDLLMPSPEEVIKEFVTLSLQDKEQALEYFYQLSIHVNYIKQERLQSNIQWQTKTPYGSLGITINLSKPEKDPKDIARQKTTEFNPLTPGPKCVLCKENVRYYPAARMNLRIVPLTLGGEPWHLQFSPYSYYQEHCIVLHDEHRPMKITSKTYRFLFDFIDQFPMYFIGSNADLPIIGGSILSHDHFQGGREEFPLFQATSWMQTSYNEVTISLLKWPLSVVHLSSSNRQEIELLANSLKKFWDTYEDRSLRIYPSTHSTPHHSVTPIARKEGNIYHLDMLLRDNRTDEENPEGIFHPHADKHHIKKENIGLIEAAGLAILPGRLKNELALLLEYQNKDYPLWPEDIKKHYEWVIKLPKPLTIEGLKEAVGKRFLEVLQDAGVFKDNELGRTHFKQFIELWLVFLQSK